MEKSPVPRPGTPPDGVVDSSGTKRLDVLTPLAVAVLAATNRGVPHFSPFLREVG